MTTILLTLFAAGVLTILLPCILPLVPIVLGVSLAGQRRARPFVTVLGMVLGFVLFTLVLQIALRQLAHLADVIRIASFYALALFGICFLTARTRVQLALAAAAAVPFFWGQGWSATMVAALVGMAAVITGGRVAARLQQLGTDVQRGAQAGFGRESLFSAFVVGMTLGLVWVPCAGPALGFALTLVRDQPGPRALLALTAYAAGAALPLLLIGYGGQRVVRSTRRLNAWSPRIKQASGAVLVLSAVALQFQLFSSAQTWLADRAGFGNLGTALEGRLFGRAEALPGPATPPPGGADSPAGEPPDRPLPRLPELAPAPELVGLGPWYNSAPLTLASLRGKVVLVDFWTYSCVNCLRTLPHVKQLWADHGGQPFVIVGVHSPEFAFEREPANVAGAVRRQGLTYPVAQDNDLATWRAFGNRYWPAKYLIDGNGVIRYTHFGEGGDEATELAIRSLLSELGSNAGPATGTTPAGPAASTRPVAHEARTSPETYLGSRDWSSFANRQGEPDGRLHHYFIPGTLATDHFVLGGAWQLRDDERQVLRSPEGEIRYRALGAEVNLVLGIERGAAPVTAEVTVDGKPSRRITIDHHDLYNLFAGRYGEHEVVLRLHGKDVAAYAFTFGG